MAQVTRYHKSWYYNDLGNLGGYISTLRSKITSGAIVYQGDIQTLINLINNAIGHYHTYDDLYQIATYGNNGDRNTYIRDSSTGGYSNNPGALGGVSTTTTITAGKHNEMAGAMRAYGYHNHAIDDRTG